MPAVGRKQKPPGQAVNRHAVLQFTEVPNIPFTGGPRLPKRCGGKPWPPEITYWWNAWTTMPHCILWSASDWVYVRECIEVCAKFIENVDAKTAAELRVRQKILGTTMDYRRDLRIRYVDPPDAADQPTVARLDDYRSL